MGGLGPVVAVLLSVSASAWAQDIVGDWQGALDVGGAQLRLVVHIAKTDGGALKANMDSVDQGAYGIPVASVTVQDSAVILDVSAIGGSYRGRLSGDHQTLDGTWTQAGRSLPLVWKRRSPMDTTGPPARKLGGPAFPNEETWEGALPAGKSLRLVLHLAKADGAGLRASLDSVDQGAYGIAVGSVAEQGSTLKLGLPVIGASYEGRLSADRLTLDGTWTQGGGSLPLVFRRKDAGVTVKPASGKPAGPAGIWQGVLDAGGVRLRLQLHVDADEHGQLTGKLDSLDQGANGLACAKVSLEESALRFEVPSVHGNFSGSFDAVRDEIQGNWMQNGATMPLDFKRGDQPAEPRRPQNPARPYPYREEEVAYPGGAAGVTLAGTLTLPPGPGPFPAALLIAGSGPQTRDEVVFGHSVFLVLADHLTRKGIAVLRVDKRGVGQSTGSYAQATSADFANDAEAGVAWLKTRKEIDPTRIGLVGHSEGGIVAPMVASRSAGVAWIVILAGDAIRGEEILLLQRQLIARAAHQSEEDIASSAGFQRRAFAILRAEKDPSAAQKKLGELHETDGAAAGIPPEARQSSIQFLSSPWVRYFLDYDPAPALRNTTCPVLALYGSKDLQVPAAQNLPVLKSSLEEGHNRDFQAEELPDLNHLFQHAMTGLPSEYGGIEETVSPAVLDEVSSWILKHSGR